MRYEGVAVAGRMGAMGGEVVARGNVAAKRQSQGREALLSRSRRGLNKKMHSMPELFMIWFPHLIYTLPPPAPHTQSSSSFFISSTSTCLKDTTRSPRKQPEKKPTAHQSSTARPSRSERRKNMSFHLCKSSQHHLVYTRKPQARPIKKESSQSHVLLDPSFLRPVLVLGGERNDAGNKH